MFEQNSRLSHDIFIKGQRLVLTCPETDAKPISTTTTRPYTFMTMLTRTAYQGAMRITPTNKYSLIADYFPHLIENGKPPRAPNIYECTRYIVMPATSESRTTTGSQSRESSPRCSNGAITTN